MMKEEKALRDQIRMAVPNPVMRRSVLLKVDKLVRVMREDEKWLLDHPEVIAVHGYGEDGFALDFGHGTSSEEAHPTLHAAILAAKEKA